MVTSELPDPGSFGAAFAEFMRVMSLVAEERESEVTVRLREHLGTDPKGLPTTGAEFPLAEHPNLQLALDAVLGDAELVALPRRIWGSGRSAWLRSSPDRGWLVRSPSGRCAMSMWR
jgi:hypothetical protein